MKAKEHLCSLDESHVNVLRNNISRDRKRKFHPFSHDLFTSFPCFLLCSFSFVDVIQFRTCHLAFFSGKNSRREESEGKRKEEREREGGRREREQEKKGKRERNNKSPLPTFPRNCVWLKVGEKWSEH